MRIQLPLSAKDGMEINNLKFNTIPIKNSRNNTFRVFISHSA